MQPNPTDEDIMVHGEYIKGLLDGLKEIRLIEVTNRMIRVPKFPFDPVAEALHETLGIMPFVASFRTEFSIDNNVMRTFSHTRELQGWILKYEEFKKQPHSRRQPLPITLRLDGKNGKIAIKRDVVEWKLIIKKIELKYKTAEGILTHKTPSGRGWSFWEENEAFTQHHEFKATSLQSAKTKATKIIEVIKEVKPSLQKARFRWIHHTPHVERWYNVKNEDGEKSFRAKLIPVGKTVSEMLDQEYKHYLL